MTALAAGPGRALAAPRVLLYHFFGEAPGGFDPENQFVSERMFRDHLDVLARGGWRAISLDDYLAWWEGTPLSRRSFLLTIDDAHESVVSVAAPILARAGIPSVLFVPSALVGGTVSWSEEYGTERLATAAELRALSGTGMELGVHGDDHTRMVPMDAGELARQATIARSRLAELVGRQPRAFAYPYGTHDDHARRAVAEAGYEVGFAVARERGRFARWRTCVDGDDSLRSFRFKLTPAYAAVSLAAGRTPWLRHKVRDAVAGVRRRAGAAGRRPAAGG
jgi:peptidoglycan/xylan/chitin deacetylase (PgdA/CDA1 family)